MTESLRQESSIVIDRPLRLIRNRVLAVQVQVPRSTVLWTPPEQKTMFADVVSVCGPPGVRLQIFSGDRIVIPAFVGVKVEYYGEPALICRYWEVLAVINK